MGPNCIRVTVVVLQAVTLSQLTTEDYSGVFKEVYEQVDLLLSPYPYIYESHVIPCTEVHIFFHSVCLKAYAMTLGIYDTENTAFHSSCLVSSTVRSSRRSGVTVTYRSLISEDRSPVAISAADELKTNPVLLATSLYTSKAATGPSANNVLVLTPAQILVSTANVSSQEEGASPVMCPEDTYAGKGSSGCTSCPNMEYTESSGSTSSEDCSIGVGFIVLFIVVGLVALVCLVFFCRDRKSTR